MDKMSMEQLLQENTEALRALTEAILKTHTEPVIKNDIFKNFKTTAPETQANSESQNATINSAPVTKATRETRSTKELHDEVKKVILQKSKEHRDEIKAILTEAGIKKLSDIDLDDSSSLKILDTLLSKVNALGAE
jgi:hypothetical protein